MATKVDIYKFLSSSNYFHDFVSLLILVELYLQIK